MKIAVVFMILLLVLLPVMGLITTGDGTLKGRLQTFISYSMSLTSLLLCMFTIIVSTFSLTNDIKQKQIFTVITKPIRRSQLLIGKLLGVIILSSVLLIIFSAIIYTITIYTPKFHNASEEELQQVRNEFFTARARLIPADVDVTEEVNQLYKKLERLGQLPPDTSPKTIKSHLTMRKKLEKRAVEVGGELLWEFENVKPLNPNQSLFIKFKYDVAVNPPDLQIYGRWIAGDYRQIKYGKMNTPIRYFDQKNFIRTSHEIEIPADVIAEDNLLAIGFINVPLNDTTIIFPFKDGFEVLYEANTFTANFIRAALLIFHQIIFLACLGVFASTFLSFPVAILLCLAIFSTATVSTFILESFSYMSENTANIYRYTLKPIVYLLPQFDKINPASFLVSARLLTWPVLLKIATYMVFVRATLLLIFAFIIFTYREIAKIII